MYELGKFLLCLTKKSGELRSTNGLELHVSLKPLKCTFLAYYISALMGCCALKFLHALEIDQALLAHTPIGAGVPKKNLGAKNMQNFGQFWTTSDFDLEYLRNKATYPKSERRTSQQNSSCV